MLVCDAAAYYMSRGKTLYDVLSELDAEYGHYVETVNSYSLSGKEGMEKIAAAMRMLREEPMDAIAGSRVTVYEDHAQQSSLDTASGAVSPTGLPKANALRYRLENGAWAVVRPSGTEPKLKFYVGVSAGSAEEAEALSNEVTAFIDGRISLLLK